MPSPDAHATVAGTFSQYFELIIGSAPEIVQFAQRLRYQVYCREFGFEREQDCPGGLEQDEYDRQAHHCLIRHRASGATAGCLRLVHLDNPIISPELPVQRHCAEALVGATVRPDSLPHTELCEISRIAISATFRRRASEAQSPLGNVDTAAQEALEARSFPLLAVALFMAARAMVLKVKKPHVFAMMEPRLARMLERSGLDFQQVGPVVDYHGLRAAYYLHYSQQTHQASLDPLRGELLELFQAVEAQLMPQLPVLAHS